MFSSADSRTPTECKGKPVLKPDEINSAIEWMYPERRNSNLSILTGVGNLRLGGLSLGRLGLGKVNDSNMATLTFSTFD